MTRRIAILSPKALLADSIALMLNIEDDIEVSQITSQYTDLLNQAKKTTYDVVILIDTLSEASGLKHLSILCASLQRTRVLILSNSHNHSLIRETYLTGGSGYLSMSESREELITAINTVAMGQQFFGKVALKALMTREESYVSSEIHQITQLTNREKEIVLLILEEKSSAEIAKLLHISQGTVESHRHNIKRKLKVKSSIGVVKYAIRTGLAA